MKKEFKLLKKLILIFLIIFLSYEIGMLFMACGTQFPREYREGADISLTYSLVNRENPYALGRENQNAYVYGPLNSLIAAVVVNIFGANVLTVHYILCFLYYLCFIGIVIFEIVRLTNNNILALSLGIIALSFENRWGYISTTPDSLGILMMFLILRMASYSCKEKKWLFYWKMALLTVLCFYIKPYFLYVGLPVFSFLLMKHKKGALHYLIGGITVGFFSLGVVNHFCPTFTINTIWLELVENSTARPDDPLYYIKYSIKQMLILFRDYWFVFLCTGSYLLFVIRSQIIDHRFEKSAEPIMVYIINIICAVPILLYIGQNTGAWLSYHRQLLCPSLLIVAAVGVKFLESKLQSIMLKRNSKQMLVKYIFAVCIFISLLQSRAIVKLYSESENEVWNSLYQKLDSYSEKGDIYLGAALAVYACERNLPVYNNGHEYLQGMGTGSWEGYADAVPGYSGLFPNLPMLYKQSVEQSDKIYDKIVNQKFGLIASANTKIDKFDQAIAENYECLETVELTMGEYHWPINLYIPKN